LDVLASVRDLQSRSCAARIQTRRAMKPED